MYISINIHLCTLNNAFNSELDVILMLALDAAYILHCAVAYEYSADAHSKWVYWIFQFTQFFQQQCGPEVNSTPTINEYQNFSFVKGQLVHKADNLTAICKLNVGIMWEPRCPTTV
jgi:hypothetical protein